MTNRLNLTFVSAPKKQDCLFDTKTQELTIKSSYTNSNNGKASFIGGELFCYWEVYDAEGVTRYLEFYFMGHYFKSNDLNLEIKLSNIKGYNIPHLFQFEIIKNKKVFISQSFISQAYYGYLIDPAYDNNDLEQDEILVYFEYLFYILRKRDRKLMK